MNYQYISFVFILVVAGLCSAHYGELQEYPPAEAQTYCGRNLARALAMLCYGSSTTMLKRSEAGTMYNSILSPYYKEHDTHVDWPWLVPYKARGMSSQRGKRQLVVTECCDKPCSVDELFTYC